MTDAVLLLRQSLKTVIPAGKQVSSAMDGNAQDINRRSDSTLGIYLKSKKNL